MERQADGRLIGLSGLRRVAAEHPLGACVEMVWRQARDAWGYGYAAEAAVAALRDGLGRAALARVLAWTASENRRSRAVMERIDLARLAGLDFDEPALPTGHPHRRHVVYGTGSP